MTSRVGVSKTNFGKSTQSRSKIFGSSKSKLVSGSSAQVNNQVKAKGVYHEGNNVTPRSLFSTSISIPRKKKAKKVKGKQPLSPTLRPSAQQQSTAMIRGGNMMASSSVSISHSSTSSSSVATSNNMTPSEADLAAELDPKKSKEVIGGTYVLGMREKTLARIKVLDDMHPKTAPSSSSSSTKNQSRPDQDLRSIITTIQLVETPTDILFTMASICIAQDSPEHANVMVKNQVYTQMCAGKHGNTDRFRAQEAQTLNFVQKNKEVMAAPPATRDAECMATNWDIADCQELERRRNDDIPDADDAALEEGGGKSQVSSSTNTKGRESATTPLTRYVNELVEANLASPGCLLQVDQDIKKALDHGLSAMAVHEASIRRDARRYDQQGATNQSGSTATGQSSRMLGSRVGINSSRTNIGGASRTNIGSSRTNIGGSRTNIGGSRTNIGGSRTNIGGSRTNIGGGGSRANVNQGSRQFSMSQSGMLEDDGRGKLPKIAPIDLNTVMAYRQSEKIMRHENLIPQFSIIERAIQQNIYHARHLLYRNFPSLALDEEEKGQKMINALSQHENGTTGTTEDTKNGEEEQDDFLRVEDPSRHGAPDASLSIIEDGHEDPHHSRPTMTTSSSGSNLNAAPTTNLPLVVLWNFVCDLTVGRTVSCMTWNTVNPDLLAVSYGSFNFNKQQDGLICFWSLKNPEFPQQIFRTACGVTSIDFSTLQPNLLAAGHYNGVVAVYDMNKQQQQPTSSSSTSSTSQDNPILSSDQEGGSHMDAVWQVKWVNKGQERGESLVSISSDGRVTEWSMKKGLSFTNLMLFKRVSSGRSSDTNHSRSKQTSAATKTSGSAKSNSNNTSDGVISRQSSGLCLDFASHDSSVYFAGTEDGVIHKCSCSYNEQYLTSYFGHTGPIYRLALSPFWPSVFLSCSADWTVKLWHQGTPEALLTFHSTDLAHAVFDVAWSPSCPTIFGSVTQDGRIEIWDLETSSLDPVITWYQQTKESGVMTGLEEVLDVDHDVDHHPEESSTRVQCTRLIFAPTSPAVAVGDNHGKVTVYQIPALMTKLQEDTTLSTGHYPVKRAGATDSIERMKRVIYPETGGA